MSPAWRKKGECSHRAGRRADLSWIYAPDLIQSCTGASCVILPTASSKVISADPTSATWPMFSLPEMFHSSFFCWMWSGSAVQHKQGVVGIISTASAIICNCWSESRRHKRPKVCLLCEAADKKNKNPNILVRCNWLITSFTVRMANESLIK